MNTKLMSLLADATAAVDATAAAGAEGEMSTGAMIIYYAVQFLPMILIFVVFYFLLIRPQRKKDKEVKNMLANLKVGDRITTIGGFYATIAGIKDDIITITFGPDSTKAMIARWAVRSLENTPKDAENDLI